MLRYKSIQSDGGAYGSVTDGDAVGIANAASKFLTHEKSVTRLSDLEIMTLIKYICALEHCSTAEYDEHCVLAA